MAQSFGMSEILGEGKEIYLTFFFLIFSFINSFPFTHIHINYNQGIQKYLFEDYFGGSKLKLSEIG